MTLQELQRENQELRDLNQAYKEAHTLFEQQHQGFKEKISSLELQLAQLYKLISGFKSERFVAAIAEHQLSLFEGKTCEEQATPATETITYTRDKQKRPGRHALPEHLPVREVVIEPEEDTTGLT